MKLFQGTSIGQEWRTISKVLSLPVTSVRGTNHLRNYQQDYSNHLKYQLRIGNKSQWTLLSNCQRPRPLTKMQLLSLLTTSANMLTSKHSLQIELHQRLLESS